MGRGLSELQETILCLAYTNYLAEERATKEGGADLYTYEVMLKVYQFTRIPISPNYIEPRLGGSHRFDLNVIGKKRYQAAAAAISKAFRRLEERGFVGRYNGAIAHWVGIKLTEAGLQLAGDLMAKSRVTLPQI